MAYHPVLIADTKTPSNRPVLIIDKKGILGLPLAQKIAKGLLTILVTGRSVVPTPHVIHVPYKNRIPVIPDNRFAQIVVVYNGEREIIDMLPTLEKKAEEAKATIAFVIGLRHGTEALYKRLFAKYPRLSLILAGDIFGGDLWEYNLVNDFLYQMKTYGTIVIPNDGLYKTYPVLHADAVNGLIDAVFLRDLSKRVYFLFPRHAVTALSVARLIKQQHPEVKLDFLKTKETQPRLILPDQGEYLLPVPYPLSAKLKSINVTVKKQTVRFTAKKRPRPYNRSLLFVAAGFLLLFLLPFLTTAVFSLFGVILLTNGKHQFDAGKYQEAKQMMEGAQNAFGLADETGETMSTISSVVGFGSLANTALVKIQIGGQVAEAGERLISAYDRFTQIQSGKSFTPRSDFSAALNDLRRSSILFQELVKRDETPKALKNTLSSYAPVLTLFNATSELYPELLGFNGKKTYLVLFQNNMELRPGGGFIGSYAIVTITNGKIGKVVVQNVYDADGKLQGHIEPPFPLRRYMGSQHLFLRDSNFSIDFPKDAAQAAYILELETGQKVDGVIGIDTSFLKSLLGVTGPLEIPQYNETISEDNFYLITERHAEKESFAGSRQKQDFLRAVFTTLQNRLTTMQSANPALVQVLVRAIAQKHFMLSLPDSAIQDVLTVNDMSGSLFDPRKESSDTVNDFFGVNEANLGQNKDNYYLRRTLKHAIQIGEKGDVTHNIEITYTNTATKGTEFGGPYKAYVRFILPNNAEVTNIAIDGVKQDLVDAVTDSLYYERASFVPPEGLEVWEEDQGQKKSSGFFLIVPEEKSKKVRVTYHLPRPVKSDLFTYSLLLFKQPGTDADPYVLTIGYSESFKPVGKSEALVAKGEGLTTFGPLTTDTQRFAKFAKIR